MTVVWMSSAMLVVPMQGQLADWMLDKDAPQIASIGFHLKAVSTVIPVDFRFETVRSRFLRSLE